MIYSIDKLTISLEDSDVDLFWNIIAFALEYNSKEHVMNEEELALAKKLEEITTHRY